MSSCIDFQRDVHANLTQGTGAHELANYVVDQLERVTPARQVVVDMVTEYVEVAQRFAEQVERAAGT